ncbi:A/G-specific adenine glycosylase, partial [bacterium]|nr:A/G-specific adenine glycosylase [bacterium]
QWYTDNRRFLPWRTNRNPYRIWVSEILLQQTQVETVRPYYLRFLKAFPTVKHLARAPLDDVLKAWEGCGYYARARNLHKAANHIMESGGKLPTSYDEWLKLPGIGPYTAAAIASIAYDELVAVVDGNVKRVLARVLNEAHIIEGKALQRLELAAEAIIKCGADEGISPGDLNQVMMEIGATVCRVTSANCAGCPLADDCKAYHVRRDVTVLPRKAVKQKLPHYDIGAAIIRKRGKILITQRPLEGMLGGLWEFPGGKQEKGETLEACVQREIREELGIKIEVGKQFLSVDHGFTHFRITLHTFDCRHISGRIRKIGIKDYRWVKPEELTDFAFPKADRVIIEKLLSGKRRLPS